MRVASLEIQPSGRTLAVSPLRYPGGKSALARFFGELIMGLPSRPRIYVEPYAGGAGAGVVLLAQGQVDGLVINDIDPAVAAFWRSVVEHNAELLQAIGTAKLDVEEWRRQKAIYRAADESDTLALGYAFFYLNRTNRSGILSAGPIGGVEQGGNYKIDARFNREQLAQRVRDLGKLAHKITVTSRDGMSVVHRWANDPEAFVYIDPPYVDQGGSLYLNSFDHRDHADLASLLNDRREGNWVLTYDPSDFVRRLYRGHVVREYSLNYSAHRATKGRELMIASSSVSSLLTT